MSHRGGQPPRAVWVGVALALTALVAGVVAAAANLSPAPPPFSPEPVAVAPVPPVAADEPRATPPPAPKTPPQVVALRTDPGPTFQELEDARALALRSAVRQEVAAQYEQIRAAVVEKCFPSGGSGPGGSLTYQVVVDANGQEIGRAVSTRRDGTPPEVRKCLRDLPPPRAKVAPPGRTVSVDLEVRYP